MSQTLSSSHAAAPAAHGGQAHAGHRFLAHHFDSQAQQFDAGKLGMWLFLVQEILFFSGLFCVYAIYRGNHPEIFAYADHFLDRRLGAINTAVLIFSSFTIAWAVRAAQLGQRRLLVTLLSITFFCAGAFLCVKYVEYKHKWEDGLLPGRHYRQQSADNPHHQAATASAAATPGVLAPYHHPSDPVDSIVSPVVPRNVHIFFGIYFVMTGLHAIHILAGMGVILWMIKRSLRGDFDGHYYGPIEYTALYWHLVDLVWIYLFPLLYLIH